MLVLLFASVKDS